MFAGRIGSIEPIFKGNYEVLGLGWLIVLDFGK